MIPPKVVSSSQLDEDILNGLCYQYKYDSRNRLVEKKLPGKQWEFIVYNKLDQPVATGPTFSPYGSGNTGWLITKYDAFGRVVYTGWMSMENINPQARFDLQDDVNTSSQPLFENKTTSANSIDGVQVNYTNHAFPTDAFELLTVNYYDNYDYPDAPTPPAAIYGDAVLTNVKSLPTGTWTRFLTNENETFGEQSTTFYDVKGRPIATHTINHLGGTTYSQSKLDFEGKVLYTDTEHQRSSANDLIKIREDFSYTPQSKLSKHIHTINSLPAELLVKNEYDELGQLIFKKVGGSDLTGESSHQKVDFQYNIRGWLQSINNINDLSESNGHFQDLFSFKIHYNTVTQKSIETGEIKEVDHSYDQKVKKLFNGNIAETYWRTSSDNNLRKYSYDYDDLNRLNNAFYQRPEGTIEQTNTYNEELDYDKNGNIIRLNRTGNYDGNDQTFFIDILDYKYEDKSNLLMRVTDSFNESLGFKDDSDGTNDNEDDYSYDDNGNMISDQNKGIVEIRYNHLNLPTFIAFANSNKIYYFYNAAGVKLKKVITTSLDENTTDYLGGFQYENTVLQFFPHAEGYVKHTPDKHGNPTFDYVYNYTDHLGNIRLSYTLDPLTQVLKILEENHYYPFGLKHTNYNSDRRNFTRETETDPKKVIPVLDLAYKYKYNGKEWQDELGLNFYDYGARNYDPAIGRWMNIDPLAEQGRRWTPYAYAMNNPVYFIDPDGMWANGDGNKVIKYSEKGNVVMTNTHTFKGHSNGMNDKGTNGSRWFFGGELKSTVHSHVLPTSGVNSSGSSSELSKNTSGFAILGTEITNSVTLKNTTVSGNYYNSKGELVKSINDASSFVVTSKEKSLTVNIHLNSVSDKVNVNETTSTTSYTVSDKSGMSQYGGLQLTNPKTSTKSVNSTMDLSSAPEALQTEANYQMQSNSNTPLPEPTDIIEREVQRTFEQEKTYDEHPVNKTRG